MFLLHDYVFADYKKPIFNVTMREEAYKVKREFLVLLKRCHLRICMLCVLFVPPSQYVQSTYADSSLVSL